jgi:hypothetical protein
MTDDYLWDRSGPEDPGIARLEQVLGILRAPEPPPPLAWPARPVVTTTPSPPQSTLVGRRFVLPFAAAATFAVAAASLWLSVNPPARGAAWQVSGLTGTPRIGSQSLADAKGQLPVGEWLETDADARARIRVAHIGRVEVEPNTRVGLIDTSSGNYRLRLERGGLQAYITATPGQFFVETPSTLAIDLGCAYTLHVADDGESVLRVTSGWVALQPPVDNSAPVRSGRPRASFVKMGTMCAARRGIGPGTPHTVDATPALQAALRLIDFDRDATPAARAAALDRVLADATRLGDATTLWHLLARDVFADDAARDRLFDRLAALAPPPQGVTRETVRDSLRTGTPELLDQWWSGAKLGLPRHGR